jgi:hypothetical protein
MKDGSIHSLLFVINLIGWHRYKNLHLSVMGAAIPYLATLPISLPPILPFAPDKIHTKILTGSVKVQDEIIPEEKDEDVSHQSKTDL